MVTLRLATTQDVPLLREWDSYPHVVAASGDDDVVDWATEVARECDWQWLFLAEADGSPVGIVMIIDPAREQSHYWGEVAQNLRAIDIWIGPPDQLGRGLGTEMMNQALEFCFANQHVSAVLIDPLISNVRARRFYQRIGFEFVENRRFGTDDCAVMRIERERFDALHQQPSGR